MANISADSEFLFGLLGKSTKARFGFWPQYNASQHFGARGRPLANNITLQKHYATRNAAVSCMR